MLGQIWPGCYVGSYYMRLCYARSVQIMSGHDKLSQFNLFDFRTDCYVWSDHAWEVMLC